MPEKWAVGEVEETGRGKRCIWQSGGRHFPSLHRCAVLPSWTDCFLLQWGSRLRRVVEDKEKPVYIGKNNGMAEVV
jgi:hypothetical protein